MTFLSRVWSSERFTSLLNNHHNQRKSDVTQAETFIYVMFSHIYDFLPYSLSSLKVCILLRAINEIKTLLWSRYNVDCALKFHI